jgi:hypothetical protein
MCHERSLATIQWCVHHLTNICQYRLRKPPTLNLEVNTNPEGWSEISTLLGKSREYQNCRLKLGKSAIVSSVRPGQVCKSGDASEDVGPFDLTLLRLTA